MKTFNQFLEEAYLILEKRKQKDDSYGFDRTKHDDLEIDYDRPRGKEESDGVDGYTSIIHRPSGIHYEITHKGPQNERTDKYSKMFGLKGAAQKAHGHKPEHDVRFSVRGIYDNTSQLSKAKKIRIARNAEKVYNTHIAPRIPSGHLVSNEPDVNHGEDRRNPDRNTRAEIYKKRAKFGEVSQRTGKQYSTKVGKRFHPVNDDGE